jgi:ribonuclease E
VAEVTSLGLVQMTRKRVGQGLLEAFSTQCEHCGGRGRHVSLDPVEPKKAAEPKRGEERSSRRRGRKATTPEVDPEVAAREAAAREALAKVAVATVGPATVPAGTEEASEPA